MPMCPTIPPPTRDRSIGTATVSKATLLTLGYDYFHKYLNREGFSFSTTREERYATEESFDWFKTYEDLKPLLSQHIASKDARILMLGCGNSSMLEIDSFERLEAQRLSKGSLKPKTNGCTLLLFYQ